MLIPCPSAVRRCCCLLLIKHAEGKYALLTSEMEVESYLVGIRFSFNDGYAQRFGPLDTSGTICGLWPLTFSSSVYVLDADNFLVHVQVDFRYCTLVHLLAVCSSAIDAQQFRAFDCRPVISRDFNRKCFERLFHGNDFA